MYWNRNAEIADESIRGNKKYTAIIGKKYTTIVRSSSIKVIPSNRTNITR